MKPHRTHGDTAMIGVPTAQNTTNLVPYVKFGCRTFYLLETDGARAKGWGESLKRVIDRKGGKAEIVPIGIGDNLSEMIKTLRDLTDSPEPFCWNLGGGQKMQQLAMSSVFLERLSGGKPDWACYSEPQQKKTYRIVGRGGAVESLPETTDVFLDLEDILSVFGRKSGGGLMRLLWRRGESADEREERESFFSRTLLESLLDYEKRQEMFEYTLLASKNEAANMPLPFPEPFTDFAGFFEACVQKRVTEIIREAPDTHCVNQVWSNVRVFHPATGEQLAEYDVLLVTNFGTIIPLDAKTFEFNKKDEHARLLNLERASGTYTSLWAVFPYFREDMGAGSLLQRDRQWKKLLSRPFEIAGRGGRMLAFTEPGAGAFNIVKRKNKIMPAPEGEMEKSAKKKQYQRVLALDGLIDALDLRIS